MKRIAFHRPEDGGLSIMTPVSPEFLDACLAICPKDAIVIDDADIPKDRTDRGAWVISSFAVAVDPVKASILKAANSSVAKA